MDIEDRRGFHAAAVSQGVDSQRSAPDIWAKSTSEQRQVLKRVARREFLPRQYQKAAEKLVREHVVTALQPIPTLEPRLSKYVLSVPETDSDWETRSGSLPWRPIVSIALLVAAAFLFATQREASLGLMTALGSIIPHFLRIVETVTGSSGTKEP